MLTIVAKKQENATLSLLAFEPKLWRYLRHSSPSTPLTEDSQTVT